MLNFTKQHAADTAFSLFFINENDVILPSFDQDSQDAELESYEREFSHMQMVDGE